MLDISCESSTDDSHEMPSQFTKELLKIVKNIYFARILHGA